MSTGILTNAGRDLFAQKAGAGEVLTIDRFLLANIAGLDPNSPADPDEALPDIADRVAELAVTKSGYVNEDKVVYSLYLGTADGDYTFNWVGILADDDTLVAVRYIDPITKYATNGTDVGNSLTRNFLITYTDAQSITNITVDASTWQLSFDQATETISGMSKRSTQQGVDDGEDDLTHVTPNKLARSNLFPRTFRNINEWLADTKLKVGQVVEILGRNEAGDGGGNVIEMVPENTGGHDNGSYIDHPNTGLQGKGLFLHGVNVLQFGAVEDSDSQPQIQAALDFMASSGRVHLSFAGKIIRKDDTSPKLTCSANRLVIENGGMFHNDTDFNPRKDLISFTDMVSLEIRDFRIEGTLDTYPSETNNSQCLTGSNIGKVELDNVEIRKVRFMATAFGDVDTVTVTNCHLEDCLRDGIRFTRSRKVTIANNQLIRVMDDCIAVHSVDGAGETSQNVVISNNNIVASQGIKCLGAKNVQITDNELSLMIRNPITVGFDTVFEGEASTPVFNVNISNNIITDSLAGFGTNYVIQIEGKQGRNVSPSNWVGLSERPYAVNYDTDFAGDSPNPGNYNIKIKGNIVSRTRPSGVAFSSFGFGPILDRVANPVYSDPIISESNFSLHYIDVTGPVSNLDISGNTLSGAGAGFSAIRFFNNYDNVVDYVNVRISDNTIFDCPTFGISVSSNAGAAGRNFMIKNNFFDLDPYFRLSAHQAGNTWSSASASKALNISNDIPLMEVSGNHFKNCATTGVTGEFFVVGSPNFVYSDFVGPNDNSGNKGVRQLPNAYENRIIPIDGDPTSPTFNVIQNRIPDALGSPPSSGRYVYGTFVRDSAPTIVGSEFTLGWVRLNTGAGNVLGTDWKEVKANI